MIMEIRIIRRFCLLMALTLGGMVSASAQEFVDSIIVEQKTKPKREFNRWGVSLEGTLLGNSDMTSCGWGLQGCYRFNTNFNVGIGLRLLYWDEYSKYWHDDNYIYHFEKGTDDDGESKWRRQLDLTLSATYILPVIKRGGIALGGTAIFSPIPLESFYISRTPRSAGSSYYYDYYGTAETKEKNVYDAFQPGLFAEAGLYYDINENGEKSRFTLMYGIGTFDMFMGSRHSKVFDQKLGDHLPSKKLCHSLTLRLTVF